MSTTPEEDSDQAAVPEGAAGGPGGKAAKEAFAVARIVLDSYAIRILSATHARECTAFDLSRQFGIPIVACYRRLRELEELGLIAPSRVVMASAGHPIRLFRSHLRSARITFEDGRLWATVELAPPDSAGEPEARLEEAFDRGLVRRKRSRAARDLGDRGAPLELVPHRREGGLDAGEAGG